MDQDKALGLDGLNPAIYHRFWNTRGKEIFHTCCMWLDYNSIPPLLNDTNIVLIPKNEHPETMKDLRPISLCSVLYKILPKVLANRMKKIISNCISEEQSAFVENRSILDNVLVASEIILSMKCKTKGKKGDGALKIDISKAFDLVDWGYLKEMP